MDNRVTRLKIIIPLLVGCIGFDQITKQIAKALLYDHRGITLLADMVRFRYAENTGAFLGMGASLPDGLRFLIFIVAVSLVLTVMLFFLLFTRNLPRLLIVSMTLILSGGLGNIVDRILFNGTVIDFMNVGIGSLRTGIFNFADFFVLVGAGLMIFQNTRSGRINAEPEDAEEEQKESGTSVVSTDEPGI